MVELLSEGEAHYWELDDDIVAGLFPEWEWPDPEEPSDFQKKIGFTTEHLTYSMLTKENWEKALNERINQSRSTQKCITCLLTFHV